MISSVRAGYEKLGIDNFYIKHSEDYCNPHYSDIKTLISEIDKNSLGNKLLDLCCGSGEITRLFLDKDIEGLDPYM